MPTALQRFRQLLVAHSLQVSARSADGNRPAAARLSFLEPIPYLEIGELAIGDGDGVASRRFVERRVSRLAIVILQADVRARSDRSTSTAGLLPKVRQAAGESAGTRPARDRLARDASWTVRAIRRTPDFVPIDQLLKCAFSPGAAALEELALVDIFHPPPY